jgi:uncharacterized RDD family membrane protein YckC
MDKRIGFGPRLGALLIDLLVLCVAVAIIGPIVGGALGAAAMSEAARLSGDSARDGAAAGGFIGAIGGLILGAPVIGALYFLAEGLTGATLGKLALGLRIGRADMTPAPIPKLLLRFCCKHPHFVLGTLGVLSLSALATFGALLGALAFLGCFAAIGEKRQALHDMIAGTAVYPKVALQAAMPAAGRPMSDPSRGGQA